MPETNEGILLVVGAVFFLIGLLGGGFEISAIKIPSVGMWARVLLAGIGVIFIGIALSRLVFPPLPAQQTPTALDTPTPLPTLIAIAPTETSVVRTNTPVLPTETSMLPTNVSTPELSDTDTPMPTDTSTPAPVAGPTSTQTTTPIGWQKISDLPRQINALVVDPTNPQRVYAATGDYSGSGSGVYKSEDTGLTWQLAATGLPNESVTALAFGHNNPPTLYAMADVRGDVFSSTDGAANWSIIGDTQLFGGYERLLRVDPRNPHILFALARSNAIVRSQDGGYTWQPIGEGLPSDEQATFALSLAIDPSDTDIIYVGTGGFVGKGQGVYRSTDAGGTWSAVNRGMLDYRITALAVNPIHTQTVYAGSDNGEFFKSTDGGQTWEELTEALPVQMSDHPTIQDIIIHPAAPDTVYVLVNDAGVVVSENGGNRWRLLGQPGQFSYTSFTAMTVIFDTEPILFVCIEGEGGWRYAAD